MFNLNKKITDSIIERMTKCEENNERFFWVKPFDINGCRYPCNYNNITQSYKGVNRLLDNGEYLTINQINVINKDNPNEFYHVRKGAHGSPIIYYNYETVKSEDGTPMLDDDGHEFKKCFARMYYVFNREDVVSDNGNLPSKFPVKRYSHDDIDKLSQRELNRFISMVNDFARRNENMEIEHITDGTQAYYAPDTNTIRIALLSNFRDVYSFIHTVSHELAHSTGLKLGRFKANEFINVSERGKEELTAEISAELIASNFRVIAPSNADTNTLAYLQSWRKVLSDNDTKSLLLNASNSAQKAFNEIYNTELMEKILEGIKDNPEAITEAPYHMINDIEFVRQAMVINPNVWDYVPEDLKEEFFSEFEMATMPNIDNQINYIEEGR